MTEALIANFPAKLESYKTACLAQGTLFDAIDDSLG